MVLPVEYIRYPEQFRSAVEEIASNDRIAVDTEANSRHTYPEQFCLIQIATAKKIYIIDPLLLGTLDLLEPVFFNESITKVFHTAEYDVRSIHKHLGFETSNVYDVAVAARFLGITRFGLADILQELLDVQVDKNKKIQEGDWGIRPLSEAAVEYAADDVRYLFLLKDHLDEKLRDAGRYEWVAEECRRLEQIRYIPQDTEKAFLRIKHARKLDGNSLAVLKSLFEYREQEALRMSIPPNYILPDTTLWELAHDPEAELSKISGLNERRIQRYGAGIEDAIITGTNAEPIVYVSDKPRTSYIMSDGEKLRFSRLREWREATAQALSLDLSLIWPRESLKRLSENPETLEEELSSDEVRKWQRDQFSASLSDLLASFTDTSS